VTEPLGIGVEEPPDRNGAFPRLNDAQRARLLAVGELRKVVPGEVLFKDGDDSYDFFVVESGTVAIVRGLGDENHVIAVHGQHRFLGELNLLTGGRVYLSGVVRDAGEVIQVPVANLRRLVADDEELSNLILRAYMARRSILIDVGGGIRVIGSRYSLNARRLREFLARNRVPYHWVDLEEDEEAERSLRALGVEPADTPVVAGGQGVLRGPVQRRSRGDARSGSPGRAAASV
jgi:thioredoxin reductase (NADPH)